MKYLIYIAIMYNVRIPCPDMKTQESSMKFYNTYGTFACSIDHRKDTIQFFNHVTSDRKKAIEFYNAYKEDSCWARRYASEAGIRFLKIELDSIKVTP